MRRLTFVTLALTAVVAFLVGAIFAGGLTPASVLTGTVKSTAARSTRPIGGAVSSSLINFADVVERINPAVVNIDATTRGRDQRGRRGRTGAPDLQDPFEGPFDFGMPR